MVDRSRVNGRINQRKPEDVTTDCTFVLARHVFRFLQGIHLWSWSGYGSIKITSTITQPTRFGDAKIHERMTARTYMYSISDQSVYRISIHKNQRKICDLNCWFNTGSIIINKLFICSLNCYDYYCYYYDYSYYISLNNLANGSNILYHY